MSNHCGGSLDVCGRIVGPQGKSAAGDRGWPGGGASFRPGLLNGASARRALGGRLEGG